MGGGFPKETGIAVWKTQSTPISSTLLCTSNKNKMKRTWNNTYILHINKCIIISKHGWQAMKNSSIPYSYVFVLLCRTEV